MAKEQVVYILCDDKKPISKTIPSRHTHRSSLLWFDKKAGTTRALRFANNQRSIYQDEQDGNAVMTPIEFEDGMLVNDPEFDALRIEFLNAHPFNEANGGKVFKLRDLEVDAQEIIDLLDEEKKATDISSAMSVPELEDFAYAKWGKKSINWKTAALTRDVRLFARNNPTEFLSMVDSPDTDSISLIEKALAEKIIQFKKGKTELHWSTEDNMRFITRLPKGTDTMKALNTFFATDEGVKVYIELEELVS